MSQPTTSIGFSPTTPAAPTGDQNTIPQSDNGAPFQTVSQYAPRMVGDTGSGGKAGTAPPPAAGDAAAGKFLKADGTWKAPIAPTVAGSIPYAVATGSVNAMVAAFTPAITTLVAGQAVIVLANLPNTTGAPTLDVGTGAKTIWKFATGSSTFGSNGLQPGDYNALAPGVYIYDGTQWQLQNPQAQMLLGAGSAGAPAYSFATASDYGMWVGSGAIRFSRSGSDIFDIGIGGVAVNGDMAASTVHAGNGFTGTKVIAGSTFVFAAGICTNITP